MRDSELAEHRYMKLRGVASEEACAREVCSLIANWYMHVSYNNFWHNVEASRIMTVILKWGYNVMEMEREDWQALYRKAGYIE